MAQKSSVSVWAQVVHVWGERSCSPPWDKLTLESDPFPRPAGRISLLLLSAFFSLGVESFGLDARSPLHCPFLTFSSLLQGDRDVIWTTALPFKTKLYWDRERAPVLWFTSQRSTGAKARGQELNPTT